MPDEPRVTPLRDTWGTADSAGTWYVTPREPLQAGTQATNAWFATQLDHTLRAFNDFARAWRVYFDPVDRDRIESRNLEWSPWIDNSGFVQDVLEQMGAYPEPIATVDVELELHAYVRTQASPRHPVRAWIRLPSDFSLNGGANAYLAYHVSHTLFWPRSRDTVDNSMLYELNRPLLEHALKRWEELAGTIVDFDGPDNVERYGFSATRRQ